MSSHQACCGSMLWVYLMSYAGLVMFTGLMSSLLRESFRAQGKEVLPPGEACEVSDPNVITTGREFLENLSAVLEYYLRARLNTDPLWKDIKVILSDANVPGEGEHMILSFIRAQWGMQSYDPNTRHCLYGLDTGLTMLALASHEVHLSILQEDDKQHPEVVPITKNMWHGDCIYLISG